MVRDHKHHSIEITKMGEVIVSHIANIEKELNDMSSDIEKLKVGYIKCGATNYR